MTNQPQANIKLSHLFFLVLLLGFLSSCAVGPNFTQPDDPQTQLKISNNLFHMESSVPEKWWEEFKVHEINQLINDSIPQNLNLEAANAALEASQFALKSGASVFYPQVALNASANKQNYFLGPTNNFSNQSIYAIDTLNASVTYALDVWGGNRRKVESLQGQVDIQQAITKGTKLSLIGNIVNTSFTIAAYQDELSIIQEMKHSLETILKLYQEQFQAGLISFDIVLNAQTQLDNLLSIDNQTQKNLKKARHLLQSLCSKTPDQSLSLTFSIADIPLPTILPTTIPSYWLKNRPDVAAALAQLQVASANIGFARAAQFPNLMISASAGKANTSFNKLLSSSTEIWGISANLTQPLFNAGALEANTDAARALYKESLANYKQTVINAFQQVADGMTSIEEDRLELTNQTQLLENSHHNSLLAQANYQAGRLNRIQYLAALLNENQAKINWLATRVQSLQDISAWYLALGH